MKKILKLLWIVTIASNALPMTIAASVWKKTTENVKDNIPIALQPLKKLKRIRKENTSTTLSKLITNTNLGRILTDSEENILGAVAYLNRRINRNDIAIARLLNNQAQIVLRETLENNRFPENNFVWVQFETENDVEIQVGNSVFYCNSDRVHLRQNNNDLSLFNTFSTPLSTLFHDQTSISLGNIPNNSEETIRTYLSNYLIQNGINSLNYYFLHISHSEAIIASRNSQYDGEIIVTFTPTQINLNSIITNTNLGTVTLSEIIPRIQQLNPLSNNILLSYAIINTNGVLNNGINRARISVSRPSELYFDTVIVTFNLKVLDQSISDQRKNRKSDPPNSSRRQQNGNKIQPKITALQQIPAPPSVQKYNNPTEFNQMQQAKNVIQTLDEVTEGGGLHAGDTFIGSNNGVNILEYNQKNKESKKFINLNFPIVDIVPDGKGSAFVANNIGEIYHLNGQMLNATLMPNMKSRNLKKELFLYYNHKQKNTTLSFTASKNINSFDIFTFNLGKINPLNYKYIEFNNVNTQAVTIWGHTPYGYLNKNRQLKINSTFNDFLRTKQNLLENVIINNNSISCTSSIPEIAKVAKNKIQDIDTYYNFAWMGSQQKFGINFYWYKGEYYLQLILFHYLDWRASFAKLESNINLGKNIKLYN